MKRIKGTIIVITIWKERPCSYCLDLIIRKNKKKQISKFLVLFPRDEA